MLIKCGRQLGLFSRIQAKQIKIPQKASQKLQSLLANLMAETWMAKKSVSRGGRNE